VAPNIDTGRHRQIGRLIYELYSLTEEEIETVN